MEQNHTPLPDHFNLCQARLTGLVRRMKAEGLIKEYDTVIRDQLQRGIIEKVDQNQTAPNNRLQYLPHHPVVRRDKDTTKLRVVYDASAKTKTGHSLNSCLYKGPCLLPSIVDILVRFRYHRIALLADIEKAFLMVSVASPNQDALRFFMD